MVRGIDRTALFREDRDRTDFVTRLASLAEAGAWTVYAWALIPDHAHLLVRTRTRPLHRTMRSLLTGCAGAFNRRHHRVGHLFQAQFGATRRRAMRAYRAFVAAGIHPHSRCPEFQGGGLLRSQGGWTAVAALRRGREAYEGDERILGSSAFVGSERRAVAAAPPHPASRVTPSSPASAGTWGGPPTALTGGGRTPALTRARAGIACLWVEVLGRPGRALAPVLGVHPSGIPKAARRGASAAAHWRRLLFFS